MSDQVITASDIIIHNGKPRGCLRRRQKVDTPGIEQGTARMKHEMLSGRDNQLHHVPVKIYQYDILPFWNFACLARNLLVTPVHLEILGYDFHMQKLVSYIIRMKSMMRIPVCTHERSLLIHLLQS